MRGSDQRTGELFSYVDLEERVPAKHPLRVIRRLVNEVLARSRSRQASLSEPLRTPSTTQRSSPSSTSSRVSFSRRTSG